MDAKLKAINIVCEFLEMMRSQTFFNYKENQTECEIIAKHRAGYFIRQHVIPTQDEPDIKFWNDVISEIDKIDFSGKSASK